jgi:hypothetical protein
MTPASRRRGWPLAHGDGFRVQPTPQNRDKFERKMKRGLARLKKSTLSPAAWERIVRDLKSDLSSHAANFRFCDGIKECRQHWSLQIASASHGGSIMPESKQSPTKKMVFWPHSDQEAVITAALSLAKEAVSTKFQTVALEAIAQNYLGAGIQFKDWKQALLYARKHAHEPSIFVEQALAFVQELCPDLVIEAKITVKGAPHEAAA